MWSESFDFAPERKIYFLITWAITLTFHTNLLWAERVNCRKNSCFWKLRWLTSCKISTTYSCVIFFSQSINFLSLTHLILFPGYRFAIGIQYNCKEVVDLRFVHPNAAQLSDIFFQKFTDTRLVYKLVGVCSLLSTCSSFSLFLFCLPDMYPCAILRENQNKRKPSILAVYTPL